MKFRSPEFSIEPSEILEEFREKIRWNSTEYFTRNSDICLLCLSFWE